MSYRVVVIDYTNWRAERRTRRIIPTGKVEFTKTDYHPFPQWFLEAVDPEDNKTKMFAMADIHSWTPEIAT